MLRYLTSIAIAALIAAAPLALTSVAADAAKATKICKHKTMSGKVKTWRCGATQPCCSAELINYYTCGSKAMGCL